MSFKNMHFVLFLVLLIFFTSTTVFAQEEYYDEEHFYRARVLEVLESTEEEHDLAGYRDCQHGNNVYTLRYRRLKY
ncbi:MAG: hypothetical protein SCJ94_06480 [Bacillota bacterium]|nr:hypothetical protein [Bacillota bacterium]